MPEEITLTDISSEDLGYIATIHAEAFPERPLTALGHAAIKRYYGCQLLHQSGAHHLKAERQGEILGYCVFGVLEHPAFEIFVRRNLLFLIVQALKHPGVILNKHFPTRLLQAIKLLMNRGKAPAQPVVEKPDFRILAIAVRPTCHRLGVGRLLSERAEEIGQQEGHAAIGLSVHPTNQRAVAFYERTGWQQIDEQGWKGELFKPLSGN